MRVLDIFQPPLVALDVGTATMRVSFGAGRFLEKRSVVREDAGGTEVVRPVMRGGVVTDIAGVAAVVRTLLESRRSVLRRRPAAVACAPTDASTNERDALVEAIAEAGASVVTIVAEPLAAAIGAGVDVTSQYASLLVDIGDGVTDLAVFRDGAIVFSDAVRIGCGTLRTAIRDWAELRQGTELPDESIDSLVRAYCQLAPLSDRRAGPTDLEMLLEPVVESIASFVATAVEELPARLAVEIIEGGIHITGGGAMLQRLVRCIEERSGMHARCAQQPLTAVIRGATAMLGDRRLLMGLADRG